jgi:low temperature requirement protein LtrA
MNRLRHRRPQTGAALHTIQRGSVTRPRAARRPDQPPRDWLRSRLPLSSRSITEGHRQASPLELLFDLTFVIAIARIGSELAHSIIAGHGATQVVPFLQVFFAIWWAWMNFTWFASSYDNDDALFRLLTMVQMAGALLLAAGVPAAFTEGDYGPITYGYLLMRVALGTLWARAAIEWAPGRETALRYASGIFGLEILWVTRLAFAEHGVLPDSTLLPVFVGLAVLEMAVPWWAEHREPTSWHPHHIAERYGLFAIILLGEGLLAASSRMPDVLEGGATRHAVIAVAVPGFALVMALWWLYFLVDVGPGLARNRGRALAWGYAQYGLFASLAALSAGLEVAVEAAGRQSEASPVTAGLSIALPVAAFLTLLSVVNRPIIGNLALRPTAALSASGCVLLLSLTAPILGIASVLSAIALTCVAVIAEESVRAARLRRAH